MAKHTVEEQLEYLQEQVKGLLEREKERDIKIGKMKFEIKDLGTAFDELEEDLEPDEDDEEEEDGDEEEDEDDGEEEEDDEPEDSSEPSKPGEANPQPA
jgi:cobalamin biosynthesis protein CobT